MAIFSMLAGCFRPPPPAAARSKRSPREAYEAEKRRWVDEQVGLILAARYSAGGYCKGAVDVSRYGGINLELALCYEFDRRWWFAQTTRLLTEAEQADAAATEAAGKSGTGGVKVHPVAAEQRRQSAPAAKQP